MSTGTVNKSDKIQHEDYLVTVPTNAKSGTKNLNVDISRIVGLMFMYTDAIWYNIGTASIGENDNTVIVTLTGAPSASRQYKVRVFYI